MLIHLTKELAVPMETHMQFLHKIDEVTAALRIGRTKIYDLVEQGNLKLVKIGSGSRITDESLKSYLAKITGDENAHR